MHCFSVFWRSINICIVINESQNTSSGTASKQQGFPFCIPFYVILNSSFCSVNLIWPTDLSPSPENAFLCILQYRSGILLSYVLQRTLSRGKEPKTINKPLVPVIQILKISQHSMPFLAISLLPQYIIYEHTLAYIQYFQLSLRGA